MTRTVLTVTAALLVISAASIARAADSAVLATLDGAPITEAEVAKVIQGRLIGLESQIYDAKKEGIDSIVSQRLLEKAAKAQHLTVDALLKKEVAARVSDPSADEVEQLYEQNKENIGRPLEEVRPALIEHLRNARIEAAREAYLQQLRAGAKLSLKISPPIIQVPGTGPSRGPANAPVTIIEFSDFQCPYCGRAEQTVEQVLSTYKDKVRLVYRDYPLSFHEHAQRAAEAAHCAGDQGKYWEYHALLFKNQTALEDTNLEQYAADLQLDKDKFKQCLDDGKYAAQVAKEVEVGNSVGVSGTPAFFINGRFLSGALPFESFKEIIDEILKNKSSRS
ncbi:MAG: thioredoxin domain-containing protein [Deltaproteobacteria bacterium]|nr:thioredoxin domain-containing protein [Deltaproteobacteria bacterium]MBI3387249.1 thioredoxin domain-containing protein [Deltaproteobacteria bacterium]